MSGNDTEIRAHEALVRDGVRPLVEAWVRWYQRDPAAALEVDPYSMGVYDVEQRRNRASEARQVAAEKSQASRVASRNGADYALLMVFFAGALTFVGLTALFHERRVRWLVLGLATLTVVGGLLMLVQLPVLT